MTANFATPKIARLYADVPAEMVQKLQAFRAQYAQQQLRIGNTDWRYIDTRTGDPVVLALSGATCIAEISWNTIDRLAQHYRVIAPDYPAIDTNAELSDGLAAILDHEGIQQAHVLGGSAGGLAAQAFVRRCPDRSASMILSHVPPLSRESGKRIARTVGWLRLLPQSLLRMVFKRSLSGLQPQAETPEIALFKAHFQEIANTRMTKAQIISLMKRTIELTQTDLTPHDLDGWPGRVLLLMSEDDPATPEPARQAMMALYPQAETRLFTGGGHAASILKQDEYLAAIEQFIGR